MLTFYIDCVPYSFINLFFISEVEADETVRDILQWLTSGIEPAHLVEERWLQTAALRLKDLEDSAGDATQVINYLNRFPALKRPSFKNLVMQLSSYRL